MRMPVTPAFERRRRSARSGRGPAVQSRLSAPDKTSSARRAVRDGPGQRADVRECAVRAGREERHQPVGRLDAEHAGERRRDADRAAAVGADRDRAHAGGHRGRRAAAGPAGGLRDVPGVSGDAGERAVGHALPAELGGGGLADQHRVVLAQPRDRGRVDVPGLFAVDRVRAAQRRPALAEQDVLDRHRHAVEQPVRLAALPALARTRRRRRASGRGRRGSRR